MARLMTMPLTAPWTSNSNWRSPRSSGNDVVHPQLMPESFHHIDTTVFLGPNMMTIIDCEEDIDFVSVALEGRTMSSTLRAIRSSTRKRQAMPHLAGPFGLWDNRPQDTSIQEDDHRDEAERAAVREQWKARVADYRASGLSAVGWCKANDQKPHRLWHWIREFEARGLYSGVRNGIRSKWRTTRPRRRSVIR